MQYLCIVQVQWTKWFLWTDPLCFVLFFRNNNNGLQKKTGENGTAVLCPLNAEVRLQWARQSSPRMLSAAVTDRYQAFQAGVPSSHNTLKSFGQLARNNSTCLQVFPLLTTSQHLILKCWHKPCFSWQNGISLSYPNQAVLFYYYNTTREEHISNFTGITTPFVGFPLHIYKIAFFLIASHVVSQQCSTS